LAIKTACEKKWTIKRRKTILSGKVNSELRKIIPVIAKTIKIPVEIRNPERKRFFNLLSFRDFSIINVILTITEKIIIKPDLL